MRTDDLIKGLRASGLTVITQEDFEAELDREKIPSIYRGWNSMLERWEVGDLEIMRDTYRNQTVVIIGSSLGFYKVVPGSVGKYTGYRDHTGRGIFEGDILRVMDTDVINPVLVKRAVKKFALIDGQGYELWPCLEDYRTISDDNICGSITIIGNKYEMKKLLSV